MKKIRILTVLILTAFMLAGCAGTPPEWQTDYETALSQAQAQDKNLLIFFSALEQNENSKLLKENIFDNPKFANGIKKDFILLNVDIPADPETLTDEEKQKKMFVLGQYPIMDLPTVILAGKDGTGFSIIPFEGAEQKPADYVKNVKKEVSSEKKRQDLREKLEKAAGAEKAKLIHELFESTPDMFKGNLFELVMQIPEIDPENESGLVGKYQFLLAYTQAQMFVQYTGNMAEAANLFIEFCDTGMGNPEEKQQAYYFAAYYKDAGNSDTETVLDLLQKAYDSAPESELAADIQTAMAQIREGASAAGQ